MRRTIGKLFQGGIAATDVTSIPQEGPEPSAEAHEHVNDRLQSNSYADTLNIQCWQKSFYWNSFFFSMLGFLTYLPHRQPFHFSFPVLLTLIVWKICVPVLVAWLFSLVVHLFCLRHNRRSLCIVALLGTGNTIFLGCSVAHVHGLHEHAGPGEVGFLDLCRKWCNSPWTDCYQARSPRRANNDSAAAINFFSANVWGNMDQFHAVLNGAALEIAGTSYRIKSPGRETLLIALNGDAEKLSQVSGWSVVKVKWSAPLGRGAAYLNALATAGRTGYKKVAAFGCSVTGKIVFIATVTAPPGLYSDAFIDSGGFLGPASAKLVGQCGETFTAMLGRWPQWLSANASSLPPPRDWPYDVADVMLNACHTTRFHFGVGRHNHWNNYAGTMLSVEIARMAGCHVEVVEGYVAHCGYFFPGTCAHSCTDTHILDR